MTEWLPAKLSDVVEFRNGLNFSEKNDGSGLPIVKVKDFGANHFVNHLHLDEIDPVGLKIGDNQLLQKNDIVLVRSNGNKDLVGRAMIYDGPPNKVAFAGFCIRGRVNDKKASAHFIHYWLRSPVTREKFSREGSGTGIQNVSQALLNAQVISLPPLKLQHQIAATLGALDDKIELNRKTAATLEEMARALYRSWFVDFDPVQAKSEGRTPAHMDPATAALFPGSFGADGLPSGWSLSSIYDVASVQYGAPFASSKFNDRKLGRPLVRIRDLKNHLPGVWTTEEHRNEYLILPGDIVVGMDGDFTPYTWCSTEALMNQRVCCFIPRDESDRAFVRLSITDLLKAEEEAAVATTVIHLGKKDIDKFVVTVAPRSVMTAFSRLAAPWHNRVVSVGLENRTLATLRDTLLPRLMSGELRVEEARERIEEVA